MRNPKDIAADLKAQRDKASTAFVPLNVVQAMDTMVEFAESVSATLDAAGLIPADKPAEGG